MLCALCSVLHSFFLLNFKTIQLCSEHPFEIWSLNKTRSDLKQVSYFKLPYLFQDVTIWSNIASLVRVFRLIAVSISRLLDDVDTKINRENNRCSRLLLRVRSLRLAAENFRLMSRIVPEASAGTKFRLQLLKELGAAAKIFVRLTSVIAAAKIFGLTSLIVPEANSGEIAGTFVTLTELGARVTALKETLFTWINEEWAGARAEPADSFLLIFHLVATLAVLGRSFLYWSVPMACILLRWASGDSKSLSRPRVKTTSWSAGGMSYSPTILSVDKRLVVLCLSWSTDSLSPSFKLLHSADAIAWSTLESPRDLDTRIPTTDFHSSNGSRSVDNRAYSNLSCYQLLRS